MSHYSIHAMLINPTEVQVGIPDAWGELVGVEFYSFDSISEAERFIEMVNSEYFVSDKDFYEFITALEFEEEFSFV